MIVEAAGRGKGRAASSEGQAQRLFGAGLADTAGNRDDPGAAALARSSAERSQAGKCIGNAQERHRRQTGYLAVHHHSGGAAPESGTDELMAVVVGSAQRNEQVTCGEAARIDRYTPSGPIRHARSAGRSRSISRGPERHHQQVRQALGNGANWTISRTIAASSKGCVS